MPGFTLPGMRELGDLLMPDADGTKAAVLFSLHAVQSAFAVREVVFIGCVKNSKLLIEAEFGKPLRRGGVRAVVFWGELVRILTSRGPSIVNYDHCQGGHPGIPAIPRREGQTEPSKGIVAARTCHCHERRWAQRRLDVIPGPTI